MSSRSDEQQDGPLLAMTTADYKSRKFVYDELVATERDYIHDLRSVMHVSAVLGVCEELGVSVVLGGCEVLGVSAVLGCVRCWGV